MEHERIIDSEKGNGERKRALFITTRLFWPADSGRKVSLYNYCRGLHDHLGYDVYLYSFLDGDQDASMIENAPSFIKQVKLAKEVGMTAKATGMMHAVFDRDFPLQCCLYVSKGNMAAIYRYADEIHPDVVFVDMVRLAPYLKSVEDYPTVMNFDDLLSKRYDRQIGRGGSNVLGNYEEKSSTFIKSIFTSSWLRDRVLREESLRVGRAEVKYGRLADSCLFVSPLEAKSLNQLIQDEKCYVASLGAKVGNLSQAPHEGEYEFGFVGNMNTAANQDSLAYVATEFMPLLPGSRILVIGVCPDKVINRYSDRPDIEFTGRVDSIENELRRCKLLLAPFLYGTGIKTKVIESMGLGMPVLTNSLGVEGLGAIPGEDLIVSDDTLELATQAKLLLDDTDLRQTIGLAGKRYVEIHHNWDRIFDDIGACIEFTKRRYAKRCPNRFQRTGTC